MQNSPRSQRVTLDSSSDAHKREQIEQHLLVEQLIWWEMRRRQIGRHICLHHEDIEILVDHQIESHELEVISPRGEPLGHVPDVCLLLDNGIANRLVDFLPHLAGIPASRRDVSVKCVLHGEAEFFVVRLQRRDLPNRQIIVTDHVFVQNFRIEGMILDGAKPEEHVTGVDVQAQRIDGRDCRVNANVEFKAIHQVGLVHELLHEALAARQVVKLVDFHDSDVSVGV